MNTKLTLRMDDSVIIKIKKFSEKHNISISKLAESLFQNILNHEKTIENDLAPITKKYKALISKKNFDAEKSKYDYLRKKYKWAGTNYI